MAPLASITIFPAASSIVWAGFEGFTYVTYPPFEPLIVIVPWFCIPCSSVLNKILFVAPCLVLFIPESTYGVSFKFPISKVPIFPVCEFPALSVKVSKKIKSFVLLLEYPDILKIPTFSWPFTSTFNEI